MVRVRFDFKESSLAVLTFANNNKLKHKMKTNKQTR